MRFLVTGWSPFPRPSEKLRRQIADLQVEVADLKDQRVYYKVLTESLGAELGEERFRVRELKQKLAKVTEIVEQAEDLAEHSAFIRSDPYELVRRLRAALTQGGAHG